MYRLIFFFWGQLRKKNGEKVTFPKKIVFYAKMATLVGLIYIFFGNFRFYYVRKPMKRDITIEGEIGTNRD